MRYRCHVCGKSVSSELPADSVIRATLVCPECLGAGRVMFRGDADAMGYPPDWPKCPGCGLPVIDGHLTCGRVTCIGEREARELVELRVQLPPDE